MISTNLATTFQPIPVYHGGLASAAVGEGEEEEQTRILPAPKVNFRRASRKDVQEWRPKKGKELRRLKKGIRATRVYGCGVCIALIFYGAGNPNWLGG